MRFFKNRDSRDLRQLLLDWGDETVERPKRPPQTQPPMAPQVKEEAIESTGATFPAQEMLRPVKIPSEIGHFSSAQITVHHALQHPQANRQIVLGRYALSYLLQRRRRRTVGMHVTAQGLEVSAPVWVATDEIERILQDKSVWIVRKLEDQTRINQEKQQNRPLWRNGQYLPWRGGLLQLRLVGQADKRAENGTMSLSQIRRLATVAQLLPRDVALSEIAAVPAAQLLSLALPENSKEEIVRDCTAYWMQQQALQTFSERLAHYAPMLNVRWQALKLSQASSRWGSANSSGIIRLHWRLMQMSPEVLDYVVVHELAHLREMNHGKRFWALVEQILPDYRQRQFLLKQTTLAPW